MATNKNVSNRLSLKVALVFDKASAQKEAVALQKDFDKQYEKSIRKQEALNNKINKSQKNINKELKNSGSLMQRFGAIAKAESLKFAKFFIVTQFFLALRVQIKRTIELLFQLDTAFTNFSIVSKATATDIVQVNEQLNNMTLGLGRLKAEVIDTVTEFNRAGFSIEESMTLAENAIKGANVGATDLANITTFLIAGLKAFNLEAEDSSRILDVLFRVANTTAINLEGIGEAFLRSANTLQTAGATLEQSASLIAAANESIQDPAKVGTALKTIASRLRGVDDAGQPIPKLAESFKAVGVSIQEADGSFRNVYDIFKDLAEILPTLDELTKESLLEKLAGKRQKNIIIGLLNNFDTAEQALTDALNSAGEVAQANEKYLESLQGRANQLKEAWNQLLESIGNSDVIKFLITLLKNVIEQITIIIRETPNLIKLIGGVAIAMAGLGLASPILGGIIIALSTIGVIADFTKSKFDKLSESIGKIKAEISELDGRIGDIRAIKNRTLAQEEQLKVLERQRDVLKEKLALEEKELMNARNAEIEKSIKAVNQALSDNITLRQMLKAEGSSLIFDEEDLKSNLNTLKKQESALVSYQLELLKSFDVLEQSSQEYKNNKEQLKLVEQALASIREEYRTGYGIELASANDALETNTGLLETQRDLYLEVNNLTSTASENYKLASDALIELSENGSLADDTLNALIEAFGTSVLKSVASADSFQAYVDIIKAGSKEEIEALKAVAVANIETAKAEILSLQTRAKANAQYSNVFLKDKFEAQNKLIEDSENYIAILDNELAQIDSTDKARKKSLSTSKKEYEAVSELQNSLNEVNFELSVQEKLLARTTDAEERIAINERMLELYEEQRNLLLQQQAELEEEGKSLKKGTEAYDRYKEKAREVSLAIEDSTNKIYTITGAVKDLEREVRESKLDMLRKKLDGIFTQSSENLIKSARMEADSIRDKISRLEEEYNARRKNLQISREDLDHQKKIADFNKEITAKELEMEMLKLDNSLESQRRRAEIAEELADLEADKRDEVDDYSRTLEDRRIEQEYENKKKALENQLELQEDFLDGLETATEMALAEIEKDTDIGLLNLEVLFETFSENVGKALSENIGGEFDKLDASAQAYIALLEQITGVDISSGLPDFGGDPSSGAGDDSLREETIRKMKANGAKWASADEATRISLNKANQDLASKLGYHFHPRTGFYIPKEYDVNKTSDEDARRLKLYDNGGRLGKGEMAYNKEQNEEWVLTDGNLMNLFEHGMTKIFSMSSMKDSFKDLLGDGTKIENLINIENMNNTVGSDVDVERMGENMARGSKNKLSSMGYKF